MIVSERERDVMNLVCNGWSNTRIGRVLSISGYTVKFHLNNILERNDLINRTHAAVTWTRATILGGIVVLPDGRRRLLAAPPVEDVVAS